MVDSKKAIDLIICHDSIVAERARMAECDNGSESEFDSVGRCCNSSAIELFKALTGREPNTLERNLISVG